MTKRKTERIARLIVRALRVNERAGALYNKRNQLIALAHALGLPLDTPVELEDGQQFCIIKPKGRWVHFPDLELKEVPKYKRADSSTPGSARVSRVGEAVSGSRTSTEAVA